MTNIYIVTGHSFIQWGRSGGEISVTSGNIGSGGDVEGEGITLLYTVSLNSITA